MSAGPVILLIGTNPKNTLRLRLDAEAKQVKLALDRGRQDFNIIVEGAVTDDDLRRLLLRHTPAIVHISGHGADGGTDGGIKFEDEHGMAHIISAGALADLFQLCQEHVNCVVLNACYSENVADAIRQYIPYVVGMSDNIGDDASLKFAIGFYDALAHGRTFEEAFQFGRNAIDLKNIPESLVPVLKKKPDAHSQPLFSAAEKQVCPEPSDLRPLLQSALRTDADFDGFCLDYFPHVYRRFAAGQDRVAKMNLLFELEDPEQIWERLHARLPPEKVKRTLIDGKRRSFGKARLLGQSTEQTGLPEHRSIGLSIGLGLLLLGLLGLGLTAGRHLSRDGNMTWWLLCIAAFALLCTAISAGIGGSTGAWQSRNARLVGPPAVFVVIFLTLLGGTRVFPRPDGAWLVHGDIVYLPHDKKAQLRLSDCQAVEINPATGQFNVTVHAACDSDPLPLVLAVGGCEPQRESITREQARTGLHIEWRGCRSTVNRLEGQVTGVRGSQRSLLSGVSVWLDNCPDALSVRPAISDDKGRFSIDTIPSSCQKAPYRLQYIYNTKPGEIVTDKPFGIKIDIILPETRKPESVRTQMAQLKVVADDGEWIEVIQNGTFVWRGRVERDNALPQVSVVLVPGRYQVRCGNGVTKTVDVSPSRSNHVVCN